MATAGWHRIAQGWWFICLFFCKTGSANIICWAGGQVWPSCHSPKWQQQWRASKSSPGKTSDDLLHISDCKLVQGRYKTPRQVVARCLHPRFESSFSWCGLQGALALEMAMSSGVAPSHFASHARSMPVLVGTGSPRSHFGDVGLKRWRTLPV